MTNDPATPVAPAGLPGIQLTPPFWLDVAAEITKTHAAAFAGLTAAERAALLRSMIPRAVAVAEDWVRAGCAAKGLAFDAPASGEEWLAGPVVVVRNLRLLAESWERIAAGRAPHDGLRVRESTPYGGGLRGIDVFPTSGIDKALFGGFTCTVLAEPLDPQSGPDGDPAGANALVLGAGNVSSIPAMDVLHKMFVEGRVCVLKMNPVNEWAGEHIEKAFQPLVDAGFLRVVYGGAEAGSHLCRHPAIDEIHITGSDRSHDLIVWGPPGAAREERKAADAPLVAKRVTSELGNVSPVLVVPGPYTDGELRFVARNVASQVTNNASFNCNAAKMLVTSKDWPDRVRLLGMIAEELAAAETRRAYYPGAEDRYRALLDGRSCVMTYGEGGGGRLRWALVTGLNPSDPHEPLFATEPFCGILSEVAVPGRDAEDFLATATLFCNARLWGTLNASIVVHPSTERDADGAAALAAAVCDLRYGTVAINHWPALGYGFVSPPWGAAPGATLANVESGIGWVHNTYMLRGVVKSVVRGPLLVSPKPAWFHDNRRTHVIGRKLVALEAAPRWWKVPGVALSALRG